MSVLAIVVIVLLVLALAAAVWHSDKDWLKGVFADYVRITLRLFKKKHWVGTIEDLKLVGTRILNVFKQHSTTFSDIGWSALWLILTPFLPLVFVLRSLVRTVFNK